MTIYEWADRQQLTLMVKRFPTIPSHKTNLFTCYFEGLSAVNGVGKVGSGHTIALAIRSLVNKIKGQVISIYRTDGRGNDSFSTIDAPSDLTT